MSSFFRKILPKRKIGAHKGDFGHVLVVAGSRGMTGAACLASRGALLSGSGLVTLGLPASQLPTAARKLTEVMTLPLAETTAGTLSRRAERKILDFLDNKADILALGPGLSQNLQTQALVRSLLPKLKTPCVLDADGINALSRHADLLKKVRADLILTHHSGEFSRLTGEPVKKIQADRKRAALTFAKRYGVVVVLKGHDTVVAAPDGRAAVNKTGNPGMAKGGCGDVLTGMVASFLGQGLAPFDAARLAVHLHGLAGDLAVKKRGEASLIASDLLEYLPAAFRRL